MLASRQRFAALTTVLVAVAALGFSLAPSAAAAPSGSPAPAKLSPTHPGKPHGFALPHRAPAPAAATQGNDEPKFCDKCAPPLVNNGGPVMGTTNQPGDNTQYSIYWDPNAAIAAGYEDKIDQYLRDVQADSGKTTNVYSVSQEYSNIVYSSHFAGRLQATDKFPADGCNADAGFTNCLSDAQLQTEISNVITANSLTGATDLAHQFVLFLPPGVESCDSPTSCSGSAFCGYHSNFSLGAGNVVYSNMPYPGQGCVSGQQPSGDPNADGEIDTLSHELNESITDPQPTTGWADSAGNENGDQCSSIYGTALGSVDAANPGTTKFNQVINGHDYYTQEEWSNNAFKSNGAGCLQSSGQPVAPPGNKVTVAASPARLPNDGTSTSTVNATVLQGASGANPGAAAAGDEVDFTTDSTTGNCGTVNPAKTTTNSSGVATTTYTASKSNDEVCSVIAREAATGQAGQAVIVQGGETYHALAPFRLADSRGGCDTCVVNGPTLGPNGVMTVPVRGQDTVPADATAAVVNITATGGSADSFFTAYGNAPRPTASNLNFVAHQTVANLATVPISSTGSINVYNLAGSVDGIVDLEGYMEPVPGPLGLFNPLSPARITDTRPGSLEPNAGSTLQGNQSLPIQVTGVGNVPATGVSAVVLNLTAVDPSNSGYLTAYPDGAQRPNASNINFLAHQVVPNRVIVQVTNGKVDVYNLTGTIDVVVDVAGWFTDSTAGSHGTLFTPLAPTRVADTRAGSGKPLAGQTLDETYKTRVVQVVAPLGLPGNAQAVAGNVTVVNTTAPSFLTVYPGSGQDRPTASDLNWVAGQVVPNQVITQLGAGSLAVYNNTGSTDVIVDISGFWS